MENSNDKNSQRIAKFIAGAGVCSRREAERMIEAGKVKVNGKLLDTPAFKVDDDDMVEVDGQIITISSDMPRIFRLHKPKEYLCTTDDPQGRRTVFDLLPKQGLPRLIMIGRLDYTTEGLLLFTTDSKLATKMMHPSAGLKRVYQVRVDGTLDKKQIAELRNGITYDGVRYQGIDVEIPPKERAGRNTWITLTLTEGKNREIRNLMRYFGLHVSRLIRTEYGNFKLSNLPKAHLAEESGKYVEFAMENVKY